jgi:YD repeat-containing protein
MRWTLGGVTWKYEHNQDSTREMTYDALGRQHSVADVDSGRTLDYAYDALGHRSSMTIEPEGEVTSYAWDSRGLLLRMTDPEGGQYHFGYDALGRRIVSTYPNGMVLHTVYDTASRVVGMIYVNAQRQLIELFGYSYDSRGNRTAKVFGDVSAELYGYDALSRLTSVTYPSGRSVRYTYDAVGNRMSMTEGTSGAGPGACAGDADCDGVLDDADNCPAIHNPTQQNSDSPAGALNTPSGLLSLYGFEEASGTTVADSQGLHPGTLQGGAVRNARGRAPPARRGGGLRLDASLGADAG